MDPKSFWRDLKNLSSAPPVREDTTPPSYARRPSFDLSPLGIAAWAKSPEFRSVLALAKTYDKFQSLQSDNSRALLYHLIVTLRPQRVLEIGTFRAGTARFLAQALHHAGSGVLYTIDPFGNENNVPAIIEAWPAQLQHHVRFSPISSSVFFDQAMTSGVMLDLVLIDGNHEFEYAAFDLACAARLMNSGGIVVLDNVDQPGPRYATQQFLAANPDWNEVAGATAEPIAEDPAQAQLPVLPSTSSCRLVWEPIEGLKVSDIGVGAAPGQSALKLVATQTNGYHRLGIHFYGLAANRKYRLVVWLAPQPGGRAMVDIRDVQEPSSQIFCDLGDMTILRQTGPIASAWIEQDHPQWSRLLVDFNCSSGSGYAYVAVLTRKGDVLFSDSLAVSVDFGGIEILSANDKGGFEWAPTDERASLVSRDLRIMNEVDPFGFVAPSFPETKFFVLKAPDGLAVSNIPRSFGSIPTEITGVQQLELELINLVSGVLHYQIFCRAFSEIAQPEEWTTTGTKIIGPTDVGKVAIKLANPLSLLAQPEGGNYRTEIILAFVPNKAGDRLYLRQPPSFG